MHLFKVAEQVLLPISLAYCGISQLLFCFLARRCSSLAASKDHLSFCDEPKPNGILVGEPDEDKNFYFGGPENANWARIEVSRNLICCWLKQLIRTSAFDDKAELQQREIIAIKQS